jgi:uncharacterized protein YbaR (Trm112 family)
MRKKSERKLITCPACKDNFKINQKPNRPQEADVIRPIPKKNPFYLIKELNLKVGKYLNKYEELLCSSCGNIFSVLLEENLVEIEGKLPEVMKEK